MKICPLCKDTLNKFVIDNKIVYSHPESNCDNSNKDGLKVSIEVIDPVSLDNFQRLCADAPIEDKKSNDYIVKGRLASKDLSLFEYDEIVKRLEKKINML